MAASSPVESRRSAGRANGRGEMFSRALAALRFVSARSTPFVAADLAAHLECGTNKALLWLEVLQAHGMVERYRVHTGTARGARWRYVYCPEVRLVSRKVPAPEDHILPERPPPSDRPHPWRTRYPT